MPDSTMDFARAALAQRRSTFLSLAPATSDSFPRFQPQEQARQQPQSPPRSLPHRTRRMSSSAGFKVLKLGPVHNGEHLGSHQDDFHTIDESGPQVGDGGSTADKRHSFLKLAPTVSSTYPRKPSSHPPAAYENHARGGSVSRRFSTSSTCSSSSLSSSTGMRVLKLVPVYWGEHIDDHKADFYDVEPTSP